MKCPCQSGEELENCCGRFISQQAVAENALQLMRSRYTAYCLNKTEYLRDTWQAQHRPAALQPDSAQRWVGLQIIAFEEQGDSATVEFEASCLADGRVQGLHEHSRFIREQGRWLYTDGDMLAPGFAAWKPGRNDPCPCGSGLKFKRCCGPDLL